jgi:hypothetical protein
MTAAATGRGGGRSAWGVASARSTSIQGARVTRRV